MNLRKREHRCADCGFLGELWKSDYSEVTSENRQLVSPGQGIGGFCCALRQWHTTPPKEACRYYIKYRPGYDPQEHKKIQWDIENRSAMRKATLMGAAIGAGAAIVSQILYMSYGPK